MPGSPCPNFRPRALVIAFSPNHAVHTQWRWWWTRRLTRRRTRRWKLFALPSCNCAVTTALVSTRAHQSHQPRGPARHCNAVQCTYYNALSGGCLECHGSVQQSAVKCNVTHRVGAPKHNSVFFIRLLFNAHQFVQFCIATDQVRCAIRCRVDSAECG